MRTIASPSRQASSHFPVLATYLVARSMHSNRSVSPNPLIGICVGSVDSGFNSEFYRAQTLMFRREISSHLNGKTEDIAKMSPAEINAFACMLICSTNVSAIMFPGSTNTIAEPFWKKGAKFPTNPSVRTANSLLKMAIAIEVLNLGMPAMFSCDASNYPVVALGGEVTPIPKGPNVVSHDGQYTNHNITVKKGTWLHQLAANVTPRRDEDGNAVLTNVSSTHPLFPKKLPDGFEVLATAPDNSASIFAVTPNVLGLVDHPEVYPPAIAMENEYRSNYHSQEVIPDSDFDGRRLWQEISNTFVKAAEINSFRFPIDKTRFSPVVQETLAEKSWAELSARQFAVGQTLSM